MTGNNQGDPGVFGHRKGLKGFSIIFTRALDRKSAQMYLTKRLIMLRFI